MTGLFNTPAPQGVVFREKARARGRGNNLDLFAAHLSEHGDTERAARAMGFSASYGRVLLQRLREKLGSQAR